MPQFSLAADGSFSVLSPACSLLHAVPGFDGSAVKPLAVEVDAHSARYTLTEGRSLHLALRHDAGAVRLALTLHGFAVAPHWTAPLFDAELVDATRIFRTGIGFSGPTNFVPLASWDRETSLESYLVTGFCRESGPTLAAGAFQHDRFLAKTHIFNRFYRHNFRNRETERSLLRVECLLATERIPLHGAPLELPEWIFTEGDTPWSTLRAWSQRLADERRIQPRLTPRSYHFCSWYDRTSSFCQADLDSLLDGLKRAPEPLTCVQIDDGYCPSKGDWLIPRADLWPGGLERAFAAIRDAGLTPGVWVGPFMVGSRSQLAAAHPDWLLRGLDGRPLAKWKRYDGSGIPGATDEETYILDTSHPEALDYVESVFRTLHQWGARFFKTDFLEWGFVDSTRVLRHAPGRTSADYYYQAMRRIRAAIGDSTWLACIAYFAPSIGFADHMRVSADVGVEWDAPGGTGNDGTGGGTPNAIEETHACHVFHNILWQNDPDVTFLRDRFIYLSIPEIEALALWNGILGVSLNTSDRLPFLPEERRRLWQFLRPGPEPCTASLPFWNAPRRYIAVTRPYPHGAHALLLFNPLPQPVRDWIPLADLLPLDECPAFTWSWRSAHPLGPVKTLLLDLPGPSAQLFYLAPDGSPPPPGLTLSGWSPQS